MFWVAVCVFGFGVIIGMGWDAYKGHQKAVENEYRDKKARPWRGRS